MGSLRAAVRQAGIFHCEYQSEYPTHSKRCSICKEALDLPRLDGTSEQAYILPCSHIFGSICITRWLSESLNHDCPNCRRSMTYRSCGHSIKPSSLSLAPTPVNLKDMPDNCVVCRGGGKLQAQLSLMQERQTAEEETLLGMQVFLPIVFGHGMCRSTIESVDARIGESRERFRREVDGMRAELRKEVRESW